MERMRSEQALYEYKQRWHSGSVEPKNFPFECPLGSCRTLLHSDVEALDHWKHSHELTELEARLLLGMLISKRGLKP